MQFDYFAENPYKKNEASFNSDRYKDSLKSEKNVVFKLLEKFDLI